MLINHKSVVTTVDRTVKIKSIELFLVVCRYYNLQISVFTIHHSPNAYCDFEKSRAVKIHDIKLYTNIFTKYLRGLNLTVDSDY